MKLKPEDNSNGAGSALKRDLSDSHQAKETMLFHLSGLGFRVSATMPARAEDKETPNLKRRR